MMRSRLTILFLVVALILATGISCLTSCDGLEDVLPWDQEAAPPEEQPGPTPPSDDETVPPSDDETIPPSDDGPTPPSDDETIPPSDSTEIPPSDIKEIPPEERPEGASGFLYAEGYTHHNFFRFETAGSKLKYEAVRYDDYLMDTDHVDKVKPNHFIAHTGDLWNGYNTCFLVYVSTGGELCYKVIDPYGVPTTSGPWRMGAVFSGQLDGYVESDCMCFVRFTHLGPYGVDVNWTDNYGRGYHAVIDQWHGLTKKEHSPADDRPALGVTPAARGRLLPYPYLEARKESVETSIPGAVVNWIREDENHLELSFDPAGGKVTGSFTWRSSLEFEAPEAGITTATITNCDIGSLTGTYSGGKTGSFQGKVTGSVNAITMQTLPNRTMFIANEGSIDGTWSAEMDADGHISGKLHYYVSQYQGSREVWMNFEATLE